MGRPVMAAGVDIVLKNRREILQGSICVCETHAGEKEAGFEILFTE